MITEGEISASIVTYNNAEKITAAISSLLNNSSLPIDIYISDNGSKDGTVDLCRGFENVKITENNINLGFGKAHNVVIKELTSKFHAIVNPDITVSDDALVKLCEYLDAHDDTVAAVPEIVFKNGERQVLPKRKPTLKYLISRRTPFFKKAEAEYTRENEVFTEPAEIDFLTGCFTVVKTEVLQKINGFDERFFMYFEDADLTLRLKEYGKTVLLPEIKVTHDWERSSAKSLKYLLIHISSMIKFLLKYRKKGS